MLAAVKNMYVGPAIHDASAKFCLQHNLLVYENRSLAAEANLGACSHLSMTILSIVMVREILNSIKQLELRIFICILICSI